MMIPHRIGRIDTTQAAKMSLMKIYNGISNEVLGHSTYFSLVKMALAPLSCPLKGVQHNTWILRESMVKGKR